MISAFGVEHGEVAKGLHSLGGMADKVGTVRPFTIRGSKSSYRGFSTVKQSSPTHRITESKGSDVIETSHKPTRGAHRR